MKPFMPKDNRAMTLVEIVIATTIFSVVVAAAGTVYMAGVKEFWRMADRERVQAEALIVFDHIHKYLLGAAGFDAGQAFPATSIIVNTDRAGNQIRYNFAGGAVEYYPDYDGEPDSKDTLGNYITDMSFTRPLEAEGINNFMQINMTTQKNRMTETYVTGVTLRGMFPNE